MLAASTEGQPVAIGGPASSERRGQRWVWWALLGFTVLLLLWVPAAPAATNNIFTVAGTGTAGSGGDDGPATTAELDTPTDVAATADGGFLIADTFNNLVRRVSSAGTITTVAGAGTAGFSGDDGPATDAELNAPSGVAAMPDGGFLIADTGNQRVRRVSPTGTITSVAGTGTAGFSGDDGPATDAELNVPDGVAATPDGGFLIADFFNNRVRRVLPGGTISTAAGDGTPGFSGDDGPATAAQLDSPNGVAATADGGFLIADTFNHRVRRVSQAGTITTVAGTGTQGFAGDGGPAIAAQVDTPVAVAATADGGFLIADNHNLRVRRVSPAGTITTVAGIGTEGFSGDGGLATAAQLANPQGLAATADGGFLFADTFNNRVRFVDADLRFPRGPQGPAGRAPLALALTDTRLRVRARRAFMLSYAATERAAVLVRVLRGRRTLARVRGWPRGGANSIRLRAPSSASVPPQALVVTIDEAHERRGVLSRIRAVSRRVVVSGSSCGTVGAPKRDTDILEPEALESGAAAGRDQRPLAARRIPSSKRRT